MTTTSEMHPGDDLPALVDAARRGDPAAQETLIGRYRRTMLAYATARLRDPDAAEDAVQEALVKALSGLGGLLRAARFEAWLMQTLRRQCADADRRRKVRAAQPLDDAIVSTLPTPEGAALDAERLRRLSDALDELPEKQRVPLRMFYVSRQSHREIALALQIPESTVQGRLAQGLRLLRRRLKTEDFPL